MVIALVILTYFSLGNVYIADLYNNRVRKVTASTGIITTIAGSGGTGSYSGDGAAATSATLNYPYGVALDSSGTHSPSNSYFSYFMCHFFSLTR